MHVSYTALHYVLLFPQGEDGWYPGIKLIQQNKKSGKKVVNIRNVENERGEEMGVGGVAEGQEVGGVAEGQEVGGVAEGQEVGAKGGARTHVSQMQFYSYRLQIRSSQPGSLHLGGRLFQQYIVDAYTMMEQSQMGWVRENQKKI